MASDKEEVGKAAAGAAGATLSLFGGVTVLKELHVLEHGTFHFDSLIHTQVPGGAGGMSVSDAGENLNCDAAWAINDFQLGSPHHLATDGKAIPATVDGPGLKARVAAVGQSLHDQSPYGAILLVGSTDPKTFQDTSQGANAALALDRAKTVQRLLQPLVGKDRPILLANDKMTLGAKPASGPVTDGLARGLFGPKETSGRSVLVCVLEPSRREVKLTGTTPAVSASGWTSFFEGTTAGFGASIVVAIAVAIITLAGVRWVKEKLSREGGGG